MWIISLLLVHCSNVRVKRRIRKVGHVIPREWDRRAAHHQWERWLISEKFSRCWTFGRESNHFSSDRTSFSQSKMDLARGKSKHFFKIRNILQIRNMTASYKIPTQSGQVHIVKEEFLNRDAILIYNHSLTFNLYGLWSSAIF